MELPSLLEGFTEPVRFIDLDLKTVPTDHGVYAVSWSGSSDPEFLHPGTGRTGSAYEPEALVYYWIPGEQIVYVGRAQCRRGIRERLSKYRRFGEGHNSGHSGGRAIWQLPDHRSLMVCWRIDPDPIPSEGQLIDSFKKSRDGRRPFANRIDGTKPSS